MSNEIYDVAILGAGPIGLEAALRAADDGYKTIVIERGEIGQNVRDWGHVKMFSPFGMNSSERGRNAVARTFCNEAFLDGAEYVEQYLAPLASFVSHSVEFRIHSEVCSVERLGWPKGCGLAEHARSESPFATLLTGSEGPEDNFVLSRSVLDTTGTTNSGAGFPHGLLEVLRSDDPLLGMTKSLNDRVAVIGSGPTAATNVVTLAEAGVEFDWFTRNTHEDPICEIVDDPLPGRRELVAKANEFSRSTLCRRFAGRTFVRGISTPNRDTFETIDVAGALYRDSALKAFVCIGQAPLTSLFRELHVHLCYATEGPIKLAAKLVGEAGADCLTQSGSDASLLVNPEPNFFILGAKSYGRNSNFLIKAGIEQVNAVFDELLPKTLWPVIGR